MVTDQEVNPTAINMWNNGKVRQNASGGLEFWEEVEKVWSRSSAEHADY